MAMAEPCLSHDFQALQLSKYQTLFSNIDLFFKVLKNYRPSKFVETDAKKIDWLKISPLVKNPQFLSNQADI